MKAEFLNQFFKEGKKNLTPKERQHHPELGRDMWSTTYFTDQSIDVPTKTFLNEAARFVAEHIAKGDVQGVFDLSVSRDGMMKLWQFTVTTDFEVMDWQLTD